MKKLLFIAFLFFTSIAGAAADTPAPRGWAAVYSHDENGKPTSGDIKVLLDGLRKGYALKIGWGWSRQIGGKQYTLEHFAEPIFLSIIQEQDVSAVINPHPLLKSYVDIDKQEFDSPNHLWQTTLTTKGHFNAMVVHRITGETVRNWPQRHRMTWYLQYP